LVGPIKKLKAKRWPRKRRRPK